MSKFIKRASATVVAALALSMAPSDTQAAQGPFNGCVVSQIGLDFGFAGGRLKIWCSNDANVYYTNPGGTCSATAADSVKIWESMAMAAFLSGKKLNFWYDDGCGVRNILDLHVTN